MRDQLPRPRVMHFRSSPTTPPGFDILAQVTSAIQAADILLAVGLYKEAYPLYRAVLSNLSESAALPLTVYLISNMSRAASTRMELLYCGFQIERLLCEYDIPVHPSGTLSNSWDLVPLHIHLAILCLRLGHPIDSLSSYFHCALRIMVRLWDHNDGIPEANRPSAYLLYRFALRRVFKDYDSVDNEVWSGFRGHMGGLRQEHFSHDELLRSLFAWCASALLLG